MNAFPKIPIEVFDHISGHCDPTTLAQKHNHHEDASIERKGDCWRLMSGVSLEISSFNPRNVGLQIIYVLQSVFPAKYGSASREQLAVRPDRHAWLRPCSYARNS